MIVICEAQNILAVLIHLKSIETKQTFGSTIPFYLHLIQLSSFILNVY